MPNLRREIVFSPIKRGARSHNIHFAAPESSIKKVSSGAFKGGVTIASFEWRSR
ncbi:MAG: hypothetical protein F6K28_56530 [Microcoleus sp. SIO2G3]|nr:hypothetical protein [Microcoleus sp. SIO2G3]